MEGIIGNIFLGLLLGLVVIAFMAAADRKESRLQRQLRLGYKNNLDAQRHQILRQLTDKLPLSPVDKKESVSLIYEFAASKNHFTLKDIEQTAKKLQVHFKNSIKNESVYKMNFPEKELLNFKPLETLNLLIIINEGLHNAAIHAQANFIFSIASIENGFISIITHDNGTGYNRQEIPDGNGIKNIEKAAIALNGILKLTSTIGNGTVVNVEIPSKPYKK